MDRTASSLGSQSVETTLKSLGGSASGLSVDEAQRRLGEFGANRVEAVAGEPLWLLFAREFGHFFALILWLAAGLAFFAAYAYADPGQGMFQLGLAIVGVIVVNGCFSFWQAYRTEQALAALQQLLPQQVEVRRDGATRSVAATELVPGDIVQLAEGTRVPADCRVIESWSLRANLATLTGEVWLLGGLLALGLATGEEIRKFFARR